MRRSQRVVALRGELPVEHRVRREVVLAEPAAGQRHAAAGEVEGLPVVGGRHHLHAVVGVGVACRGTRSPGTRSPRSGRATRRRCASRPPPAGPARGGSRRGTPRRGGAGRKPRAASGQQQQRDAHQQEQAHRVAAERRRDGERQRPQDRVAHEEGPHGALVGQARAQRQAHRAERRDGQRVLGVERVVGAARAEAPQQRSPWLAATRSAPSASATLPRERHHPRRRDAPARPGRPAGRRAPAGGPARWPPRPPAPWPGVRRPGPAALRARSRGPAGRGRCPPRPRGAPAGRRRRPGRWRAPANAAAPGRRRRRRPPRTRPRPRW